MLWAGAIVSSLDVGYNLGMKNIVKEQFRFFEVEHKRVTPSFAAKGTPYALVVNSEAFRRLKDISFLGAIDYAYNTKIPKSERSRATHSLQVAALANYISTERNYSDDLKRHLVVAALLHDIGHSPLSHSVEPYTKNQFGLGHHQLSQEIITGRAPLGKTLNFELSKIVNIDFILRLINQEATEEGSDLFNSPINIDTIDGIVRSFSYLTGRVSDAQYDRVKIAQASFLQQQDDQTRQYILDHFWGMKHKVYSLLINGETGLLADKASEYYFQSKQSYLTKSDLYKTEKDWKNEYRPLFDFFRQAKRKRNMPDWLSGQSVSYRVRRYDVNSNSEGHLRYVCKKELVRYSFDEKKQPSVQFGLFFSEMSHELSRFY